MSGLRVVSVLDAVDRSLRAGGSVRIEIADDLGPPMLMPAMRVPEEVSA